MLFTEDYIESVKIDPVSGTMDVCNRARAAVSGHEGWIAEHYDIMIEAYSLLAAMYDSKLLPNKIGFPVSF